MIIGFNAAKIQKSCAKLLHNHGFSKLSFDGMRITHQFLPQSGNGFSVECFEYHRLHFIFNLLKNAFIREVFFVACCGSIME